MAAITPTDLNNAKLDVDHMAALATSAAPTAVDRFGQEKKTWTGIEAELGAEYAVTTTAQNRFGAEAAAERAESASDGALVKANIYVDTAAGLADAAIAANGSFQTQGAGEVAVNLWRKKPSPNLYNPAAKRVGKYVLSSGLIGSDAAWDCTPFIPTTPGETISISSTSRRVGLGFFGTQSDADAVAGSYNSSASNPLTIVVPPGGNFLVANLKSNTVAETNVQIERGAPTTYAPFGTYAAVPLPSSTFPSGAAVDAVKARAGVLEEAVAPLPTNYVKNYLPNGNMAGVPAWTYTGTAVRTAVAAVAELAAVGIPFAYSIPTAGGVASQARMAALLAGMGVSAGDNLLLGCFVYAADGASFPTSFNSFTIRVDGATLPMDTTGYVQVAPKLRFMWGRKLVPAGALQELIVGFVSASVPASGAVRYHGGYYVHRDSQAIAEPSLASIKRYTGWLGQGSSDVLFTTLQEMAGLFGDGAIGRSPIAPKLVLGGTGAAESYIEVQREGHTLRRSFTPFPDTTLTSPSVFNFRSDSIDGMPLKVMSDDVAPYRIFGTTLGANHGYQMTTITAAAHGKTQADLGSVYADSTALQHVLLGVVDANTLLLTNRGAANGATPIGLLTHVAGGATTTAIAGTARVTGVQFYPPFKNRSIRCFVDGVEVMARTANLAYSRQVVFVESYEIADKAAIITWFEANGASGALMPQVDASFAPSIAYAFDHEGNCTIASGLLVLKDGVSMTDAMLLQAQRMSTVDGPVNYYIRKALPLVHEGNARDFANIASSDTTGWTTRLDLTPARCEPAGLLADSVVQLSDHYGFAMGLLPLESAGPDVRRSNATVKAMQISDSSGKLYMATVDKGVMVVNKGDYFSAIGYRNLLIRSPQRTVAHVVRTNAGTFFVMDWHGAKLDRVPVPPDLVGRPFTVVEKSSNVTVLSKSLTGTLLIDVDASASYGYLTLRIN